MISSRANMEEERQCDYLDLNLTWYEDTPDFSHCLKSTYLVWIPCAFFWFFLPLEVFFLLTSKYRQVPISWINTSKLVCLIILGGIVLANIINNIPNEGLNVVYISLYIKLATYIMSFSLILLGRKRGIFTSGIQLFFWLLSSLCGVLVFWSNFAHSEHVVDNYLDGASFGISFYMMILYLFSDRKPLYRMSNEEKRFVNAENETEEEFASFLSRITYHWLNSTIWRLRKGRSGNDTDNFRLTEDDRSSTTSETLERYCKNFHKRKTNGYKGNIIAAIFKAFVPNVLGSLVFQLLADVLRCTLPLIFWLIIDYNEKTEPLWKGVLYCLLLFLFHFLSTLFSEMYGNQAIKTAARIKSAIISLLFKKIFLVSCTARNEISIGEILNCVSVDVQKLFVLTTQIHQLLCLPVQLAISAYVLWRLMGVAALIGLSLTIIFIPIVTMLSKWTKSLEMQNMILADIRIKTTSDILSGIKVLKLYGWEMSFLDVVLNLRKDENRVLLKLSLVSVGTHAVYMTMPLFLQFLAIAAFLKSGANQSLTPVVAFVSFRFFYNMKYFLESFYEMINCLTVGIVAVKRINKILNCVEIGTSVERDIGSHDKNIAILVENGDFKWSTDAQRNILSDINIVIPKGCLVAVVGEVGSGKSSLISALLGEMEKTKGDVFVQGAVAYVPQQAWILNASVKDNIRLHNTFVEERYKIVIEGCALEPDLQLLPAYDETEIGERGINLSGGQKQRVSLGRAIYSDADVFLLDDPLGAVDAHVGKHIFDNVIGPDGILKNKTRFLVTHNLNNLQLFDLIIVMQNGQIKDCGSPLLLLNRNKMVLGNNDERFENQIEIHSELGESQRLPSTTRESVGEITKIHVKKELVTKEKIEDGSIAWSVFYEYVKKVGYARTALSVILQSFTAALILAIMTWLNVMTRQQRMSTEVTNYNLAIYGCFLLGELLCILLGGAVTYQGTIRAADELHKNMLKSVLRSPMSFFDTTPTGRILNRFTKDIGEMDTNMMMCITRLIALSGALVGYSLAMTIYIPQLSIIIVVVLMISLLPKRLYAASSSLIKRMDTTTRSPVLSHFTESIAGVSVITAYRQTDIFVKKAFHLIDKHGAVEYMKNVIIRWLTVRMNCLYAIMFFSIALFMIIQRVDYSPGTIGLVLNLSFQMSFNITMVIYLTTNLESSMVCVERILEYSKLQSEAPWENKDIEAPNDWPSEGKIEFKDYSTLYRKELEPVLKHLSFSINSKEKVGVVGRTGAGKSSLTLALFRLLEAHTGIITIDGVDISKLGLFDLRSRLTIIPQDPVLFSGSLRLNLDPFNKHTDADIWTALEHAHLKRFVKTFAGGLNHIVSEGGHGMSVGQRQLMCLARALLRRTKVLVLDEATASVDMDTDDLIQATIRNEFSACTIITIAHRLQTIMDYDRVMVLNNGLLTEFEKPRNLLNNRTSLFYGLCKEAGLA